MGKSRYSKIKGAGMYLNTIKNRKMTGKKFCATSLTKSENKKLRKRIEEISANIWKWFVRLRNAEKNSNNWDQILKEGAEYVRSCTGIDHIFAKDMYLLYLDRVERLEKRKGGRNEN